MLVRSLLMKSRKRLVRDVGCLILLSHMPALFMKTSVQVS